MEDSCFKEVELPKNHILVLEGRSAVEPARRAATGIFGHVVRQLFLNDIMHVVCSFDGCRPRWVLPNRADSALPHIAWPGTL